MNKILSIFSNIVISIAIFLLLFQYIPTIIHADNGMIYAVGNLCFHYLNVLFYTSIMTLIFVCYYGKINKKIIATFSSISLIMSYVNFTFLADNFFKKYDLYLNVFKSSVSNEFFFQYALIMLLCILFVYCIGVVFFIKKHILKYLFFVFISSFYLFFYVAHEYVVKEAYVDWSYNNTINIQKISNNADFLDENSVITLCKNIGYHCFYLKNENNLNFHFPTKNLGNNARRIHPNLDKITKDDEEGVSEIKNRIEKFRLSDKKEQFFHYKDLDSLRATVFLTKKVNDKIFVLIDTDTLCRGLDMYLLYISFITTLFLTIWGSLLHYLYKKHLSFNIVKNNELS